MNKAKVFFTSNITADSLVKIHEALEFELGGRVAVKISTGEPGGHNYLKPELIGKLVDKLNGTIVECNTAYKGRRNTTEEHIKTAREHGFLNIANVDIMDADGSMSLVVNGGKHLKENLVGKNLQNYDSMLMLSHFKGHQMGGFGGALKNMSIGVASASGKTLIHSAGKTADVSKIWSNVAMQDDFLESMAEACKSVIEYMQGKIVYINVINNLSIDCDCSSNPAAPCMKDIGIVASLDPVAIDKASLDYIYNATDEGKHQLIKRIEEMHGMHTVEHAETLGLGNTQYEIIYID